MRWIKTSPSGDAEILDALLVESLELLNAEVRSALGKPPLAKSLDDTTCYWPESPLISFPAGSFAASSHCHLSANAAKWIAHEVMASSGADASYPDVIYDRWSRG